MTHRIQSRHVSLSRWARPLGITLCGWILTLVCILPLAAKTRPNVILLMSDDQGYGDIARHGNPRIHTPNLDRLYDQSLHFTDFHVSPFCAPTRAALMTGRLPDRTYVWRTIQSRNHLNRDEVTMAEFFHATGYRTGIFGKWHLGRNYPYRPIDRGFDQWVGLGDGGLATTSDYWGNDRMNDHYYRNGKWEPFRGFCTDIYFDEAMKFIEAGDGPFFVYLATNVAHSPHNVLAEWRTPYAGKLPLGVVDFYATISRLDWNIGRLRAFLDKHGLAQNTILIFLSDNGGTAGVPIFNAGMRGKKGSPYDGGHRVPLFVHWPASGLNRPVDVDRLAAHVDLLPTLIELCDLRQPARKHLPFDGRSLAPLLWNPRAEWKDRKLVLHSQNELATPEKWHRCVVLTQRWRLVQHDELYDIEADPGQKVNAAGKYPEVVSGLQSYYDGYWNDIRPADQPPSRPIAGSPREQETWLTCDAWLLDKSDPRTWSQAHVRAAVKNNGVWPVEIAAPGTYRFDVRRWPKEADWPIAAAMPASTASDITLGGRPVYAAAGEAIPAVKVRLKVGDVERTKSVEKDEPSVAFDLELPAGNRQIRTWLIDKNDQPICGAYYVYIRRLR